MAAQQRKIAYITGSSRGIGNALALKLLNEGYDVVGLSRSSTLDHSNYTHNALDLSDLNTVKKFEFTAISNHVLLINNAGMLGDIAPIGILEDDVIERVMNVNSIAPQILMNRFIKTFKGKIDHAHIINISSGAGKNAIDAWATYCASKAAIDLYSATVQKEFEAHHLKNWYIHSIAPGVVDTAMQTEIRNGDPKHFTELGRFKLLKSENQLSTTNEVAEKLFLVISSPSNYPETIISVRDF